MGKYILSYVQGRIKDRLHNPELTTTTLNSWINNARDLMVRDIKPTFLNLSTTFVSVAAQSVYYIPYIPQESVREIVDVTNDRPLIASTDYELNTVDIDRSESSDPTDYVLGNITYILKQPTAASAISLRSSSAADTTQVALVRGISGGIEVTESKTLNGTTAVATTTTFTSLISITLDTACVGNVTATSNAGAITNVSIPLGSLYTEYLPITLWPTPSTADDVYRIHHYKHLPLLENAADPLHIPDEWVSTLVDISLIEGHRQGYEFQPSELLIKSTEDQINRFARKYQRSRTGVRSMIKDFSFNSCAGVRSSKPVG